ncbi:MAG: peptidoglycan DD-metalloendopeptidase family protein [Candidatus Binatia bacterium]
MLRTLIFFRSALFLLVCLTSAILFSACGLMSLLVHDTVPDSLEPKILLDEEIGHKSIPSPPSTAGTDWVKVQDIYHKLERGQTLYWLSRLYQVPVDKLMRVNRITDPTRIRAGKLIFVPGASAPSRLEESVIGGLIWPLRGRITTGFGTRGKRSHHEGIDIDGEGGDEVRAAAAGTVIQAGTRGDYGRTVVIDHGDGLATLYAHASKLLVRVGDRIEQGDPVAMVGRSGNASGTHLHFEVHRNGKPVDPVPHLEPGTVVANSPR